MGRNVVPHNRPRAGLGLASGESAAVHRVSLIGETFPGCATRARGGYCTSGVNDSARTPSKEDSLQLAQAPRPARHALAALHAPGRIPAAALANLRYRVAGELVDVEAVLR
jgi:hypothetical protein